MSLFERISRIFGGGGPKVETDRGLYYYLQCDKCREVIRVRVDPQWDLAPDYDGGSSFTANKYVIGQKCYRPIEVTLTFDNNRQETERQISGGKFITAEEYAALATPTPSSS